jgi:pimeloyl-ACP methyl ester carboxylesterase
MRGEFIDVGGVRLYYYAIGDRGAGEPIVLIHGFPTSGHVWNELAPLLPTGHRIIVLDLLGYGRSDRPIGHDVSIRGHADRIIALLDALHINYAAIVGHDLGGGIAQQVAVRFPARVSRLALLDSVGFDLWPSRESKMARAMMPLTRHLPASWITSIVRTDLLRGYVHAERGNHSIDHFLRPFSNDEGRDALMCHFVALDSAETQTLEPRLKDVVSPTAIIWGAEDPFLPRAIAERLSTSIPHATLDYIADGRHFTPEESPARVADLIAGLMKR